MLQYRRATAPGLKKLLRNGVVAAVAGFVVLQLFPATVIGLPTQEIAANRPV
jgi:hypothetical protein